MRRLRRRSSPDRMRALVRECRAAMGCAVPTFHRDGGHALRPPQIKPAAPRPAGRERIQARASHFLNSRPRHRSICRKSSSSALPIGGIAHRLIGQDELAELLGWKTPASGFTLASRGSLRARDRHRNRRPVDPRPSPARREARARNLMRIGLPCHGVGQPRHPARMARRGAPGKARYRKIETAPEKMHGTSPCRGTQCGTA